MRALEAVGPFLRLTHFDPELHEVDLSIEVVLPAAEGGGRLAPEVALAGAEADVSVELIMTYKCLDTVFEFWRLDLKGMGLAERERKVDYVVMPPLGQPAFPKRTFWLQARGKPWVWAAYSCNEKVTGVSGPDDDYPASPLWDDILRCHARRPLQFMLGNGDQLYNDHVLGLPGVARRLGIDRASPFVAPEHPDRFERMGLYDVPAELRRDIRDAYFRHYMVAFAKPQMAEIFASIPQLNQWDDHDIFDGWGSFPDELLRTTLMREIYAAARLFYFAFQQHSVPYGEEPELLAENDPERARRLTNGFGVKGCSFVRMLGPDVALVSPDLRSERTCHQVMLPESHRLLHEEMAKIPTGVRHIVLASTIPVTYLRFPCVEPHKFVHMQRILANLYPKYLRNDIVDEWAAPPHQEERRRLVDFLQGFARERGARVTFVSGDVHVAAIGCFRSSNAAIDPTEDSRLMFQFVSSALAYPPPPMLAPGTVALTDHRFAYDEDTVEEMWNAFRGHTHVPTGVLLPRNNWLRVIPGSNPTGPAAVAASHARPRQKPSAPTRLAELCCFCYGHRNGPAPPAVPCTDASLVFELRAEATKAFRWVRGPSVRTFAFVVPPLTLKREPAGSVEMAEGGRVHAAEPSAV